MDGLFVRFVKNELHRKPLLELHVYAVKRKPVFNRGEILTSHEIQESIHRANLTHMQRVGSLGIQIDGTLGKVTNYPFDGLPEGLRGFFKKKGIAVRLERAMILRAQERFPHLSFITSYPPVSNERIAQQARRGISNPLAPVPIKEYLSRMDAIIQKHSRPEPVSTFRRPPLRERIRRLLRAKSARRK